jgi:putative hydrolase of the HAD superfamily
MPLPAAQFERPDFRHVRNWIFDLDNTLYPSACNLFSQIDARMALYMQERLGVSRDDAKRLQKAYYHEHGTTLNGLMNLHSIDAEDYLAFVHDIDLSVLAADAGLKTAITALPGRKFVFTNGCVNHAIRVLAKLDLAESFETIWDIRTIRFTPKPHADAYRTVLAEAGSDGSDAAMFEDIARNLVEAKAVGMTTVLLANGSEWSRQGPSHPVAQAHHIDYETDNLAAFLRAIRVSP